jgi:hypothetical protein
VFKKIFASRLVNFFNPEFSYVHITEAGRWRLTNGFQRKHND